MAKHVMYIISHVHKSLAFEWIAQGLKNKYRLTFVLLNPDKSPLEQFLIENNVAVKRINYRGKRDFMMAWIKLVWLLLNQRPFVIHAHLYDAQLIGLTAAWCLAIDRRIYTRHTSNYHHIYAPKGVKFDKLSNWLATGIVSISGATDETLLKLENAKAAKVVKIPHGFDLDIFSSVATTRVESIREKWNIKRSNPVIGVVARHIEWKGVQYVIPAFEQLLKLYPHACLVLANAGGPYHEELKALWKKIPIENICIIPFEEDIASLYRCFDLYVHVPVDNLCEAFGQTYVEALAAGVPSVFTLSGIAPEFIKHMENAWVVDYKNSIQIYEALKTLLSSEILREQFQVRGKVSVAAFTISAMIKRLEHLYDE
jgi:glycosyltransferase involved in cell wall biosynthesis